MGAPLPFEYFKSPDAVKGKLKQARWRIRRGFPCVLPVNWMDAKLNETVQKVSGRKKEWLILESML
jgi:hypothetical protein